MVQQLNDCNTGLPETEQDIVAPHTTESCDDGLAMARVRSLLDKGEVAVK